jgi:oligopeptide/dipeptide ABC transporter ATP-binding protein
MYVGQLVELAPTEAVFARPYHPYTAALMRAVPVPDPRVATSDTILKGEVPSPAAPPSGCYFHPRCRFAEDRCRCELRAAARSEPRPLSRCHFADAAVVTARRVTPRGVYLAGGEEGLLYGARGFKSFSSAKHAEDQRKVLALHPRLRTPRNR